MTNRLLALVLFIVPLTCPAQIKTEKSDSTDVLVLDQQLSEVVVSASNTKTKYGNKTIYKIATEKFLPTTKMESVLNTIPSLSIINGEVLINNRKHAAIRIDGIEASAQDLKHLDATSVEKVEVIANPSASFGEELQGGVINIIRKKENEHQLKGELEASKGVRLDQWSWAPSLSYKNHFMVMNAYYSHLANKQMNHTDIERSWEDNTLNQQLDRNTDGWQDYASSRMRFTFSPKSDLSLTGGYFKYKFDAQTIGFSSTNDENVTPLNYSTTENVSRWSVNGVYAYKLSAKSKLYLKGRTFQYANELSYTDTETNYSKAKIRDYSGEIESENKQIALKSWTLNVNAGYKYVSRTNEYETSSFTLSQNIHSLYVNTDVIVNPDLSFSASCFYNLTRNQASGQSTHYDNLLPMFSASYQAGKKTNLSFDYSRKITRPSADYLNPVVIRMSSIYMLQGNPALKPQLNDNIEFTLSQSLGKSSVFINLFRNNQSDLIDEVYHTNGDEVVNTYDNIGKAYTQGASLGANFRLFKLLQFNCSSGVDYTSYSSSSTSALVNENDGYAFRASLNVSMITKNGWFANFGGNYRSKSYTLIGSQKTCPYLFLSVEKNFFHNLMTARVSYTDMFNLYRTFKSNISSSSFAQKQRVENNISNCTFTLVFRLGKKFSDRFSTHAIGNGDIITK